jgi:hypothetical protein
VRHFSTDFRINSQIYILVHRPTIVK